MRTGCHRIPQCSFFLSLFLLNLQALSPGSSLDWLTLGESLSLRLPFLLFNIIHNKTHFFTGLFQVNEFFPTTVTSSLSLVRDPSKRLLPEGKWVLRVPWPFFEKWEQSHLS